MWSYVVTIFHRVNRNTDMSTLWPVCKEHAKDLDHAKAAFFMHVINDPAWPYHYSEQELKEYVDKLT